MNSAPVSGQAVAASAPLKGYQRLAAALLVIAAIVAAVKHVPVLDKWPSELVIPARIWITDAFAWLAQAGKPVTRSIAWILSQPLALTEALLYRGFKVLGIPPLPWVAVAGGVAILGHWIGGRKLALLGGLATAYLAIFGLWTEAMKTVSIVIVIVPLAVTAGFALGLWAFRNRRFEKLLNTCFDIMQATPHMAYLAPVVVLFGFGQVPALIATFIFALPPMGRCTILGMRTVQPDVIEAGHMSGCTKRQLLWKVQTPAAQQTLLLGVNQVVMQTLAMVVIASLVGAAGLGQKLLFSLQQLQVGKAVEQGVAITLIAVVLDRMSQSYMRRIPAHREAGKIPHKHLLAFGVLVIAAVVISRFLPAVLVLPKDLTFSYGAPINQAVRWISRELFSYVKPVRDTITIWALLPLRDFCLWLPWPVVLGSLAAIGWVLGGLRLALLPVALLGIMLLTGFWTQLMLTVYLVASTTVLSILIGTPIGIWAARRPFAARIVNTICDTLQTFPSFIYLIPVIMLFQTSDLSNVLAMLAYATVPMIRYAQLGLKRVPQATVEAAVASGTTPFQRLVKVELPIAFPELLMGINQTIMMALAMVAITALIGSQDLGQEIYKALPGADTGRGLLAGLGIAFIGITANRFLGAWAAKINRNLGM
ncbi:ABC transporter permease subunit [Sinorhizobium medicae]|uniref:ABC transmembrane type-1 domain-containing protein n=8 Tax=Sinorhizobium medicae TaxID=110321 RepID=A0A508X6B1_9HYPH|nr:ABC transporter permease subunit [Sinorhizobium medicae]MBO1939239.1 ABC transporter permease subunit [Sinorhizobium medicae]MDX0422359.1 ABC transporter permease subunit [Sinorhizobium medicae]MDX0429502.1 ABC transporter permease subunit [Sinorhizobium medicae]MDX0443090.1 ABC transporter permease subunit [Sinorhizobium medicae]MDX0461187.1 ABC transporter permease subunit [Sinorhizobium medicae]